MAGTEKVSVALSPELLEIVKGAVDSGEYASAGEVVREALRQWHIRKPLREAEIERLQRAWIEGTESGTPRPVNFAEIKRKGRERLAQIRRG